MFHQKAHCGYELSMTCAAWTNTRNQPWRRDVAVTSVHLMSMHDDMAMTWQLQNLYKLKLSVRVVAERS